MIRQFKNTEEALDFGRSIRNNPQLISLLRAEREKLVKIARDLMNEGKEAEALALASGQSQFTREALEEATK